MPPWISDDPLLGDYVGGKAHGIGLMTTPWGSAYAGQWFEGNGHGWGSYSYCSGERYTSRIRESQIRRLTRPSNTRYEGQWHKGKREGWGIYTFKR